MAHRMHHHAKTFLIEAASRYDFVLVPGRYNSGEEHWQSCWEQDVPIWRRINQRNWDDPDIEHWISAIRRTLPQCRQRAILVGHSLGALSSGCVAVDYPDQVAGLMMVAPAEPSKFEAQERVPEHNLGVPALIVASQDDPFMSFPRAQYWSSVWQGELIDLGEAGHINVEAGFGHWPYGLTLLSDFVKKMDGSDESTA